MSTPYSDGPKDSKIAVIAEAPSYAEIAGGKPLIGPSGGIYETCLHSAGLARGTIYSGNVSRKMIGSGKELLKVTPKKAEWTERGKVELHEFEERARELDANVFIPMGNIALKALCNQTGISKFRGSILPCSIPGLEDRKVIPTYHPAATLRGKSIWKHDIILDFLRADRESSNRSIPAPHGELIHDPTLDEVYDYLHECEKKKKFAHDIEVYNFQLSCMSFSHDAWTGLCIPFFDMRSNSRHRWTEEQETELWRYIASLLCADNEIIGQNYIFDMSVMALRNGILPRGKIRDAMVAHSILYPNLPKGLDYLCSVYTNIPYYKDDRKLWDKLEEGEEAQDRFWEYSAKDPIGTYQAWNEVEEDILDDPLYKKTYDRTMALYDPLLYIQQKGMNVDVEERKNAAEKLELDIQKKLEELHDLADYEFNPGSPQQCAGYFYDHKGIKPYTNDGRVTTDDIALRRIYKQHNVKEAKLVQEYRNLSKLHSNSMTAFLDPDNRFRCSMNPRGTIFGRLSSSETIFGTGGNMQNLDLRFKHFLKPDEGHFLLEFDKAGSEWVIMAYLTQDPKMLEVVQGNISPHVVTSHLSTGMPMELIVEEDKKLGHMTDPEGIKEARIHLVPEILDYKEFLPANMTVRQAYKKANHGLNYGFGYKQFALKNDMLERDAKRIHTFYHRSYPGIEDWHKEIRKQLKKDRTLVNCFGRKVRFLGSMNDELYRSGYSMPAQSTNVDMVNDAMIKVWHDEELRKFELLMQVHDSLLDQHEIPDTHDGWFELGRGVHKIAHVHMTPELEYNDRKFTVKTELKVSKKSWADMEEVSINGTIDQTVKNLRRVLM